MLALYEMTYAEVIWTTTGMNEIYTFFQIITVDRDEVTNANSDLWDTYIGE